MKIFAQRKKLEDQPAFERSVNRVHQTENQKTLGDRIFGSESTGAA